MATVRKIGLFPLALVTNPPQYGLTDLVVKRFRVCTEDTLPEATDITSTVDIDEYMTASIAPFSSSISVSSDRDRGLERVGITGDVDSELVPGQIIHVGTHVYKIRATDIASDGDGYIDLHLPLREGVAAGDAITRAGNTGRYRITIREDNEDCVQYNVTSPSSLPALDENTPVVEISDSGDTSTGGTIRDNSQLLL